MKRYLFFILLLLFISCKNKQNILETKNNYINKNSSTIENKLIGIWGIIGEENSTFQISVDSIYYTDQDNDNVYKYIVKGDSLFIFYDGYTYKSIYNLFQDKLILTGSDGVDTFIKYTK